MERERENKKKTETRRSSHLQSPSHGQAQGHVNNGLPIASLMLIACLVAESIQLFLSLPTHCDFQAWQLSSDPLISDVF